MIKCIKYLFGAVFLLSFIFTSLTNASASMVVLQDSVINVGDSSGTVAGDEMVVPKDTAKVNVDSATVASPDSTTTAEGAIQTDSRDTGEASSIDSKVYVGIAFYILLFVLICIVIAVFGRVLHISTLTKKINGKYNAYATNDFQARLLLLFLILFLSGIYYGYAYWGSWSWREASTLHGQEIDKIFIVTVILTTFVLIVVHILLLLFAYFYRSKPGRTGYFYSHNNFIEIIWTSVPSLGLLILVAFGFLQWRKITNIPEELKNSALQVEVLGEQFLWTVRYPGIDGVIGKRNFKLTKANNPYGIDFNDKSSWDDIRADNIVLPVNIPVRFHIISKDIIHSFYIPDFRVQINAVPGMTNYFQFTPTVTTREMRDKLNDQSYDYVMLCAKICGSSHYNMQKKVVVVTEAEYKEWLAKQSKFFTEDLQKDFANTDMGTKNDNRALAVSSVK